MLTNDLTDTDIKNAIRAVKKSGTQKKVFDGKGLFLLVKPSGSALWRFKYIVGKNEKGQPRDNSLSFGPYPEVSLKQARDKRDAARSLVANGVDPSAQRKKEKLAAANTFAQVAEEYVSKQADRLARRTLDKARWQLREFLNPHIGSKPINTISAPDLLAALRKIEERGKTETAHKSKELAGRVFLFGIATGRCERNVAADLKMALKPRSGKNLAAITDPAAVGALMRAIAGYTGLPATAAALRIAPYVFLRPGELRGGRWAEVDLDAAIWRLPADRMKMRREHLVPLSRQAVAILKKLKETTAGGEFMFPAIGRKERCLSDGTLGSALRTLGYTSDVHCPHGFRTTASTLLHEQGFVSSDIELQLAHADGNKIRAVYNRSERLSERTAMMQSWADYLDGLRDAKATEESARAA